MKLFNFSRFLGSLVRESDDPVFGGATNSESNDPVYGGGIEKPEITTMAEHILHVTKSITKDIEDLKKLRGEIARVNYRDDDKNFLVKFCDECLDMIRNETKTGPENQGGQ
jgi:hypothetical protein